MLKILGAVLQLSPLVLSSLFLLPKQTVAAEVASSSITQTIQVNLERSLPNSATAIAAQPVEPSYPTIEQLTATELQFMSRVDPSLPGIDTTVSTPVAQLAQSLPSNSTPAVSDKQSSELLQQTESYINDLNADPTALNMVGEF